jgi:hypothetical protein
MRIAIELPIEARLVPAALAEIRREGAQRRQVYPRLIEAGKLAAPTAQRLLLALADAYRVVEAVATAVAPLIEAQREAVSRNADLFAQGARAEKTKEETRK